MAEETGHIRALTDWVIDQAIAGPARPAREAGHDLTMSINISGRLVDDAEFADRAIEKIAAAGARFCFEITETAVIGNPDVALGVLASARPRPASPSRSTTTARACRPWPI